MDEKTFTLLVQKAQEFSPTAVSYMWQGGEPMLMGLDFFLSAVAIQERHRKPDQVISNGIQTNGVMINEEWARFFAQHRFLTGISIDGPMHLHDIHRFTRTRKSVFEKVLNACNILKKYNVDFNILTVVNNDNVQYPEELYTSFLEHDFYYLQFIPCLEIVDNEITPFSVKPEAYGNFLCKLFDIWFNKGYPEVYIRLFDNLLQYRIGLIPECCEHQNSCGNYLLIEYNGDVYPCDFFVTKEWRLGNIYEDSIEEIIEKPRYKEFAILRQHAREECEQCKWLGFCQRGCTKFRYLPQMNYDAINYLCEAYKIFLEYTANRYNFLTWDIVRRKKGLPPPRTINRNDPCFCGSGKKYKKCCEPYSFILDR